MSSQLLLRSARNGCRVAHIAMTPPSILTSSPSAAIPATCSALPPSSALPHLASAVRSLHTSRPLLAEPQKAKKGKKEAIEVGPLVIPTSMDEYPFDHMSVYKEYKNPAEKPRCQPDSSYPPWIWDQQPEPTWGELLMADFNSLSPQYQKKIFSITRKQEIKKHNALTKKG